MATNETRLFLLYDPARRLTFPPICCACAAPAKTTDLLHVRIGVKRPGRFGGPNNYSARFDIPYCAIHANQARRCRWIRLPTQVLALAAVLIAFSLVSIAIWPSLRGLNGAAFLLAVTGLLAGLAVIGFIIVRLVIAVARALYPPLRACFLAGTLGLEIVTALSGNRTYPLPLAITVLNGEFACRLAEANADIVTTDPVPRA